MNTILKELEWFAKQFREAVDTDSITCECGRSIPLRFAYRCLYCGCYFCQRCAEEHFGKTRAQYLKELDEKKNDVLDGSDVTDPN